MTLTSDPSGTARQNPGIFSLDPTPAPTNTPTPESSKESNPRQITQRGAQAARLRVALRGFVPTQFTCRRAAVAVVERLVSQKRRQKGTKLLYYKLRKNVEDSPSFNPTTCYDPKSG